MISIIFTLFQLYLHLNTTLIKYVPYETYTNFGSTKQYFDCSLANFQYVCPKYTKRQTVLVYTLCYNNDSNVPWFTISGPQNSTK